MRIDPADLDSRDLYRLMISAIVPRPIAWVSTISPDGATNAAPFSYFQALSSSPPSLMISVGKRRDGSDKDTRANIEATGEFVVNVVSEESAEHMVRSSVAYEPGQSEFEEVGFEPAPSEVVKPPRIAESAVSMECRLDRVLEIGKSGILIGTIQLFHVRDDVVGDDGNVDPHKLRPLGRLGGQNYAPLREVLQVTADAPPTALHAEVLDAWAEVRDRSIAMARAFGPAHLARPVRDGGLTVGGALRHLGACTAFRVLEWENRKDEFDPRAWDAAWTAERIAAELEQDKAAFVAESAARLSDRQIRRQVGRMTRHEAWHQGQIAAALHTDFPEDHLWML
jgi:flavin reductase (DIM6/NTAB) family NADH-FMN oxidoreductase RutF